jgi:hypothetical protein
MTRHELGDAPIESEYVEQMTAVAMSLDVIFNGDKHGNERPTGFVLLVFPFGDIPGRCNFISNGANREDIIALFKEMIARFEGQPEMKGKA